MKEKDKFAGILAIKDLAYKNKTLLKSFNHFPST